MAPFRFDFLPSKCSQRASNPLCETNTMAAPISPRSLPPIENAPRPQKSLLPAWLLESTKAVEASAANRRRVESRIVGLRHSALVLDHLMDSVKESYVSQQAARAEAIARRARGESLIDFGPLSQASTGAGGGESGGTSKRPTLGLHRLPVELTNIVAGYMGSRELGIFSLASSETNSYMLQAIGGWAFHPVFMM